MNTAASLAKTARVTQSLRLRDVAAVIGRSHVWVQLVESGRLAPSADDLARLSDALGVDLSAAIQPREGRAS
jgi:transcriptional regulator with XRE-family HTH domain